MKKELQFSEPELSTALSLWRIIQASWFFSKIDVEKKCDVTFGPKYLSHVFEPVNNVVTNFLLCW